MEDNVNNDDNDDDTSSNYSPLWNGILSRKKNVFQHSYYIVDDQRPKDHKNNSFHLSTDFESAASSSRENATPRLSQFVKYIPH